MATQRYTAEQVAQALTDTRGLVWPAAQKLGCSDETIYNYMKRYDSVRRACESQRNRFLDNTELRLVEAVEKDKAPWAIAFTLRTIGRHRGYVEKTEQDVNQNVNVNGTITHEHRVTLESYREYFKRLADDDAGRLGDAVQSVEGHGDSEPVDSSRSNGKAGTLPDGILS